MNFATLAILALLSVGGFYYLSRFMSARPDPAPTTGPVVGGFGLADLFAALLLMTLLISNAYDSFGKKQVFTIQLIVISGALYFALVIGLLSLLIVRFRNPVKIFGLRWTRWRREIPLSFLALLSIYPAIILVQTIVQHFYGPEEAPQEILQFLLHSPALRERLLLIFFAIVIAPIAEELIFRGFIFGTLRQYIGRWAAVLISSAIFAVIHGHAPALPGLFILAVLLALVYERTGSLWSNIMLHATFNSVTIVVSLLFPSITL